MSDGNKLIADSFVCRGNMDVLGSITTKDININNAVILKSTSFINGVSELILSMSNSRISGASSYARFLNTVDNRVGYVGLDGVGLSNYAPGAMVMVSGSGKNCGMLTNTNKSIFINPGGDVQVNGISGLDGQILQSQGPGSEAVWAGIRKATYTPIIDSTTTTLTITTSSFSYSLYGSTLTICYKFSWSNAVASNVSFTLPSGFVSNSFSVGAVTSSNSNISSPVSAELLPAGDAVMFTDLNGTPYSFTGAQLIQGAISIIL